MPTTSVPSAPERNASHASSCRALQKVEVHTCTELREALANAAVKHVLLMPRPGGSSWNCSAEDFPPYSVDISGRDVLMEGHGDQQLHYDVSWTLVMQRRWSGPRWLACCGVERRCRAVRVAASVSACSAC